MEKNQFTGQIAFDFIQSHDGQIYALECNPRATSGVHLLASHPKFAEAFLNPNMDCITPTGDDSSMLATAMLVYGLPRALKQKRLAQWVKTFFTSDDVILDFKDPMPFISNLRVFLLIYCLHEKKRSLRWKHPPLILSGMGKKCKLKISYFFLKTKSALPKRSALFVEAEGGNSNPRPV